MNATNPPTPMLARHPWILVLLAFGLLIGAWTTLITVAVKHAPQQVDVPTVTPGR